MAKKLDLNKLRDEIDKEKQNKNMTQSSLGESVGTGVSPRDVFLKGLLEARETGADNAATTLIKTVENKTTEKHGGITTHKINETAPMPVQPRTPTVEMSPERDEQLFRDLETKRKATLAESIQSFTGSQTAAPPAPAVNYNGQQYLTSAPAGAPAGAPVAAPTGAPMQINEAALVENVKNVVNGYLSENLGVIFEEAIKGTIIEMYAVERIKEVLNENRDLVKSVVVETIREIQAKSKAKG
jgi:hypothetical protein